MTTYYTATVPSFRNTSSSDNWWRRSPYYPYYYSTPFGTYSPSKDRSPPKEELRQMSDEEFSAAFNDLLFGTRQEESGV